jgi:predicted alpha/beta-fold hydrolase
MTHHDTQKNTKEFSFKPAWWLPGAHLQTLWAALFRKKNLHKMIVRRERIELKDGDFVDIDWVGNKQRPLVLILHGLEGSINSPYAQGLLQAISQSNAWQAGVLHFRSCSGELNRLPRFYHSGDTADLIEVVQLLKSRNPHLAIVVVGVSMGANILLKCLGQSNQLEITAAIAISTPFNLKNSVLKLQRGFSRIYDRHLLKRLVKKVREKFKFTASPINLAAITFKNLYDFDEFVTAPLHGFKNAEDYYQQSSCCTYLKNISVPTLILHARDDPFMTPHVIPTAEEISASTILEVYDHGGHVGFVAGNFWSPVYWLEGRVLRFLELVN